MLTRSVLVVLLLIAVNPAFTKLYAQSSKKGTISVRKKRTATIMSLSRTYTSMESSVPRKIEESLDYDGIKNLSRSKQFPEFNGRITTSIRFLETNLTYPINVTSDFPDTLIVVAGYTFNKNKMKVIPDVSLSAIGEFDNLIIWYYSILNELISNFRISGDYEYYRYVFKARIINPSLKNNL